MKIQKSYIMYVLQTILIGCFLWISAQTDSEEIAIIGTLLFARNMRFIYKNTQLEFVDKKMFLSLLTKALAQGCITVITAIIFTIMTIWITDMTMDIFAIGILTGFTDWIIILASDEAYLYILDFLEKQPWIDAEQKKKRSEKAKRYQLLNESTEEPDDEKNWKIRKNWEIKKD